MFDSPEDLLKLWIKEVNAHNLSGVIRLYDAHAILLPTFSNKFLNTVNGITDYFEKLSTHKDLEVKVHDNTLLIQSLAATIFSISGIYCWRFEVDGELLNFEARFTFLVDISHPSPIVHHHSSQVPRML